MIPPSPSPASGQPSTAIAGQSPSLSPVRAKSMASLTTAPNAVVEPIHPKAVPVILTTEEERDVWLRAPTFGILN